MMVQSFLSWWQLHCEVWEDSANALGGARSRHVSPGTRRELSPFHEQGKDSYSDMHRKQMCHSDYCVCNSMHLVIMMLVVVHCLSLLDAHTYYVIYRYIYVYIYI